MPHTLQLHSIIARSTLLSNGLLAGLLLTGCAEKSPHLDTTTVTTPVGRPGVCERCDEQIEKVAQEHLVTVRGNQYIVCDEKCEADLKDWLAKQ